jgi:hypothetical protein
MIRSKNAGPLYLTLDVMLPDADTYRRVLASGVLDPVGIGHIYGVQADQISTVGHDGTNTVKVTFRRPVTAGDPGDTDLYGAQQYVPLLDLEVPG